MLAKYLPRALNTDWKKMALVKKAAGIFLCISRQSSHSGWQPRGALGLDCRSSSCRSTEEHVHHPVVFKAPQKYDCASASWLSSPLQAVLAPPPSCTCITSKLYLHHLQAHPPSFPPVKPTSVAQQPEAALLRGFEQQRVKRACWQYSAAGAVRS